jgi:chromosome segregation protein
MYLKSLELSGFKSFAKKATLEFNTPITAIVGPNGSGKSNVAEAFRFVLGEQSIKSMRGRRTEDLIWNGSKTTPKSNRAHVKLTFDNASHKGTRLFDVDFDEVILERVIHRDSNSEYHLNGSPSRLKDIFELLSGAHIGASGHHIISQGEADRILSVNARERKTMVEDALGLKMYQYKKEESLRKLEKTKENLEKAESIRRELKPHLKFLEKQVEKVAKARQLAETLVADYREYFAREKVYLMHEKKRIEEELAPHEKNMHRLEREIGDAREQLQKLSQKDTTSDALLASEKKLRDIREKKDATTRDVGRVEGEIAALETLIVREEKRQTEDAHRTVPFTSVSALSTKLLSHITDALVLSDIAALKSVLSDLRTVVSEFITTVSGSASTSGEELADLKKQLGQLRKEKETLDAEISHIATDEREHEEEYKKVQHTIETDMHSGREMERKIFTLSNEQQDVRMKVQTLSGLLQSLSLEEEEFKRELTEAGALVGLEAIRFDAVMDAIEVAIRRDDRREERKEQISRKKEIERMKIRLEEAGSAGGNDIMKEFEDVSQRDAFLEKEIADLTQSADALQQLITDLNDTLAREFADGIKKINTEFATFFALMFGGGTASLEIVKEIKRARHDTDLEEIMEGDVPEEIDDGEEKILEGVEIKVSLPRKKIHGLEMLSGGERALTSIALIFAMSQVNPPPFIILDETDAALDEANSKRYGDMIENLSAKTQLILITHNRETMSRAGVLYGVTMGQDAVSQLLSVSFTEAVAVAK